MKARLEYLICLANEQPIVKIILECPYEAYWFRNRADAHVFKIWGQNYDVTFSIKSKPKSHKTNTGAIPKTRTFQHPNHISKMLPKHPLPKILGTTLQPLQSKLRLIETHILLSI